jgi:hypothetical protein
VVTLAHRPETGDAPELRIVPAGAAPIPDDRLTAALSEWEKEFPGLTAQPSGRGYQLALPPSALVSHEATFALVLDDFLDRVDGGTWSPSAAARIRNRYRLLARATAAATDLAQPPPLET